MPTAVDAKKTEKLNAVTAAQARKDVKGLEKFLSEELGEIRSEAAKALVALGVYDVFVKHAGDKDWKSASASIQALGETGEFQYYPLLLEACSHKDANVKTTAMALLARQKVTGALEAIANNLGDRFWPVRQSAIQSLVVLGGASALRLIIPFLKDKQEEIRGAAAIAITQLRDPLAAEHIAEVLPTLTFSRQYTELTLKRLAIEAEKEVKAPAAAPAAPERQFFVFSVANGALAMILQTGLREVGKVKGFPLGERTLFLKYTNQPIEDAHEKSKVPTMTALNSLAGPWILVVDIATLEDFQSTSVWKYCQMVGQVAASPQPIIDFVQKAMS